MKKQSNSRIACVALCAVFPFVAPGVNWITSSPGTHSWTDSNNWKGGTVPTSSLAAVVGSSLEGGNVDEGGRQTITGDGTASYLDVTTAYPVKASAVRTFAGNVTAGYGIFRSGTNEISGTDLHAAVGPDGQLIPAPGLSISIR